MWFCRKYWGIINYDSYFFCTNMTDWTSRRAFHHHPFIQTLLWQPACVGPPRSWADVKPLISEFFSVSLFIFFFSRSLLTFFVQKEQTCFLLTQYNVSSHTESKSTKMLLQVFERKVFFFYLCLEVGQRLLRNTNEMKRLIISFFSNFSTSFNMLLRCFRLALSEERSSSASERTFCLTSVFLSKSNAAVRSKTPSRQMNLIQKCVSY